MKITLQDFYKEILEWVDTGTPFHPVFRNRMGLCGNLSRWLDHKKLDYDEDALIWKRQNKLFNDLYGDSQFPFGEEDYKKDFFKKGTHYKNESRLAFIRAQVEVEDD